METKNVKRKQKKILKFLEAFKISAWEGFQFILNNIKPFVYKYIEVQR